MSEASIKLHRDKKLVGTLSYGTPTDIFGGPNPAKWKSTKEKLDPLLDELFKILPWTFAETSKCTKPVIIRAQASGSAASQRRHAPTNSDT